MQKVIHYNNKEKLWEKLFFQRAKNMCWKVAAGIFARFYKRAAKSISTI